MISIPNPKGWEGASLILKNLPKKLYGNANDELLFWPIRSESTIDLVFFVGERRAAGNKKQPAVLLTITATSKTIEVAVKKHPSNKYFFSGVFVGKVFKKVNQQINELLSNHNNQLN